MAEAGDTDPTSLARRLNLTIPVAAIAPLLASSIPSSAWPNSRCAKLSTP
jgi:hypothetical protein